MKKIFFIIFLALILFPIITSGQEKKQADYFYAEWCPHCKNVENFFVDNGIYEKYDIQKHDFDDAENKKLLAEIYKERNYTGRGGIPTILIDDKMLIGDGDIISFFKSAEDLLKKPIKAEGETAISSSDISLTILIGAALVDAVNPCAFAVLILLVATVIGAKGRKKALASGLLFSLTIFISYFLIGIGVYKTITIFSLPKFFSLIIGVLAVLIGLANLKDAFWHGKIFLMEIPVSWRPKVRSIISGVTSPLGAVGAGFIVSLFLLPCTSGPYVIILGMLAQRVEMAKTLSLLALYNLIFVFPMIVITLIMYFGFRAGKIESFRKQNVRLLHAVGGTIMLLIGIYLISSWI